MTAIAMDQNMISSLAFREQLVWAAEEKSFLARLALARSIPERSQGIISKMRICIDRCARADDMDNCIRETVALATAIARDMRGLYGRFPSWVPLVRRGLDAADAWEELAEDLELIATAERRQLWGGIAEAARGAAPSLPSWRESTLFQ